MKMKCLNGSECGKMISASFFIPDEEEAEDGVGPYFYVDCLDLLCAVERGDEIKTAGNFTIDALELIMSEAHNEESADIVAEWLEHMAAKIRAKYKAISSPQAPA